VLALLEKLGFLVVLVAGSAGQHRQEQH